MVAPIDFATDTELSRGLAELIKELEKRTNLRQPIRMLIAGGMATMRTTSKTQCRCRLVRPWCMFMS